MSTTAVALAPVVTVDDGPLAVVPGVDAGVLVDGPPVVGVDAVVDDPPARFDPERPEPHAAMASATDSTTAVAPRRIMAQGIACAVCRVRG
jgi:hypothetical protein